MTKENENNSAIKIENILEKNIENNNEKNTQNNDSKIKDKKLEHKKTRNQLAYLIISFNQGIGSISELAVQYFFKDELKLEPARLAQIMSLIAIPWMIKPIFGLLTDLVPICGYRRKVYIILCGIMNVICWLAMAFLVKDLASATCMLFLINIGLSFSTVLGEAIVVELSQLSGKDDVNKSSAKDYVSMFFICKYIGFLVSAYMKGLLIEIMSIRTVFLIASVLPWLLVVSGIVLVDNRVEEIKERKNNADGKLENDKIPNNNSENQQNSEIPQNLNKNGEKNVNNNKNLQNNNQEQYGTLADTSIAEPIPKSEDLIKNFYEFLCQKYVLVPTLFLILFMAVPSYSDALFYFLTNELKFTPSDLGKISFCSTFAALIAMFMYKWYLKNCDFKLMITIGTILSFFFSFLAYVLVTRINVKLGISDFFLVLFCNSFLSLIGEFIMMPMLSLACLLCPKNLEGTVYSLFMSALNFGGILSGLNGSFLMSWLGITATDYHNLDKLILISNIMTLIPLPFLCLISTSYFQPELNNTESSLKNEDEEKNLLENKNGPHSDDLQTNSNSIK